MIAADSSSLVAYFAGERGKDVDRVAATLADGELVIPPPVVTEILSDPTAGPLIEADVANITMLTLTDGFWTRAGASRRILRKNGLKARIADVLIAQSCIDHDVALITRDRDFRHFVKHCGLKLA
jgi:predicted nucleic acid-binding protein